MVDLGTDLHGLGESLSASGDNHELLERELVAGVRATVNDVHGRGRENVRGLDASKLGKVGVKGNTLLAGAGLGDGHRNTEDGVSAELALVGGAVELDEEVVNFLLRGDGDAGLDELRADDLVDVLDSLGDTCDPGNK